MADNINQDQDQNQDPFNHPIRNNNWWLYIIGGLVMAGIIIWFFVDWAYKDRDKEPIPVENADEMPIPQAPEPTINLPAVTVDENEGNQPADQQAAPQQEEQKNN